MPPAGAPTSHALTVWILQTGEPLHIDPGDPRPMRAMNVANSLVGAGHKVIVWSSTFSHQEKRQRSPRAQTIVISRRLEYRLIPSPGYERNIGIARLWDHALLARSLGRLLDKEAELPDVCFVGYPPIETAAVMTRWAKRRQIPTLLDVKDQWPVLFLAALPRTLRGLGTVFLSPYFVIARRAMREATAISAMADGFLQWAIQFAGRSRTSLDAVIPLTSPRYEPRENELAAAREWWTAQGVPDDGTPRFCFVGSHTRSFDFSPLIAAAKTLAEKKVACDLIICGAGECSADWVRAADGLTNMKFPGWVSPPQVRVLAERSSGFLAPYIDSDDFARSIPNKVIDALSLGLPVVTSLGGEVATLIDRCGIGLRYGTGTGRTLAECLAVLIENPELEKRMSRNASELHDQRFSYDKVYGELVAHLEKLAATGDRPLADG